MYNLKKVQSSNYWHFGGNRLLLLTKNAKMTVPKSEEPHHIKMGYFDCCLSYRAIMKIFLIQSQLVQKTCCRDPSLLTVTCSKEELPRQSLDRCKA